MFTARGAQLPLRTKSAAKVLQIFEINKALRVKNKFIYIFSGKDLLFAQLCERTFGGTLHTSREDRRYTNICKKK